MNLMTRRRALMAASGGGGFGFVIGSYNSIDATTPNTITVRYMQRNITDKVSLTNVPNIHQGDTVAVTFELVSGDELSGRFTCKFGGITVVGNKTVSNWGGLTTTITADADASIAEFAITKNNTGNYNPSNPPTVKISVAVNGVTIM